MRRYNPVCKTPSFSQIPFAHCVVGMVATATRTILESLDRLPNEDNRTKIAIIAFDVSLYFFSMAVSWVVALAYSLFSICFIVAR